MNTAAARDIAEARDLLEKAERETDAEQKTLHIEEALLLLETVEDPTEDQVRLIANLRTSYARRLLTQLPALKSADFEVWLFYYNVLEQLSDEIEALAQQHPDLARNRDEFLSMWGPDVVAAAHKARQ